MSHIDENEALNDDQLSDEGLDEGELLKDSGEGKNMAAKPGTSGANISLSTADFKILSLAIFNVSKRLDKLEEKPSATGKGPGKRKSQEHQNTVPAKECSSSSSEQNTSENDDVQTLMAKVASDDDDLGNGDEDETLTELQKEYVCRLYREKHTKPTIAKLLGKMFRNRLPDKVLKEKLEQQARPENCETVKPTRVNPGIWRKLREPTQKRDLQLYKMQQALVNGIIPVARLTDLTLSEKQRLDKEGMQLIKKFGLDALSLLTHVNYELNMQRKQLMKPDIGKDYAALCSPHVPFTDLLFGDDLQKQLKDIGDVNKIGAKVQNHRGSQRNPSGYSSSNTNRHTFSQRNPKNSKGQTFRPWRHKETPKMNPNKRSSQ